MVGSSSVLKGVIFVEAGFYITRLSAKAIAPYLMTTKNGHHSAMMKSCGASGLDSQRDTDIQ